MSNAGDGSRGVKDSYGSTRRRARRNSVIERWSVSDNREDWSFEDVQGNLVAFATDSAGTHFLQKIFTLKKRKLGDVMIIS